MHPGRLYVYAVVVHDADTVRVIRQPTAYWAQRDSDVEAAALASLPPEFKNRPNDLEILVRRF